MNVYKYICIYRNIHRVGVRLMTFKAGERLMTF